MGWILLFSKAHRPWAELLSLLALCPTSRHNKPTWRRIASEMRSCYLLWQEGRFSCLALRSSGLWKSDAGHTLQGIGEGLGQARVPELEKLQRESPVREEFVG